MDKYLHFVWKTIENESETVNHLIWVLKTILKTHLGKPRHPTIIILFTLGITEQNYSRFFLELPTFSPCINAYI